MQPQGAHPPSRFGAHAFSLTATNVLEQDWQEVVFKRKKPAARAATDPVAAKAAGVEVVTEKKCTRASWFAWIVLR